MFGVFAQRLTKPPYTLLLGRSVPETEPAPTPTFVISMEEAANQFDSGATVIKRLPNGIMASMLDGGYPPRFVAVKDDIYVLFQGRLENPNVLRDKYKMTDDGYTSEADLLIKAYLKVTEPRPRTTIKATEAVPIETLAAAVMDFTGLHWHKEVEELQGQFSFILFDAKKNSFFAHSKVPDSLFWGTDAEKKFFIISTCKQSVMRLSDNYNASIPTDSFIETGRGLRKLKTPNA